MVPFYYFGHSLSSLNGYYEQFQGNPDAPIAWGVSAYNKLYNWTGSTTASMPNTITGRKCTGLGWLNCAIAFVPSRKRREWM